MTAQSEANTYRCCFAGCDQRDFSKNELYWHGVLDHGESFGAGYPEFELDDTSE